MRGVRSTLFGSWTPRFGYTLEGTCRARTKANGVAALQLLREVQQAIWRPASSRSRQPPFSDRCTRHRGKSTAWIIEGDIQRVVISAPQPAIGSWQGCNHHNFNEHPRSPKVGREASPRRRVCRIYPLGPNRIVIFEQTHVADPDLGAQ